MGFQQGLSGLNAASKNLDVIGNNIANSNTAGFKASQARFADVFASSLEGAGGTQVGIGTKVDGVVQQFTQGNITATSNPLDVAVNGNGFFRFSQNGTVTYSRNGQLQVDKDGYLVNGNGLRLTGYQASSTGVIAASSPGDLKISTGDLTPSATTKVDALVNLDSRSAAITATFDPNDSTTYNSSTSFSVYDSLGNAHTITSYFVKSSANAWKVYASNDGTVIDGNTATAAIDPVGTLNFTSTGAINTATTTLPFAITSAVATGATTPLNFNLDFTGTSQFGSPFGVNNLSQNGFTSGRLTRFDIGSDGIIKGRYSNGQALNLGQAVLADFKNPQGLQPLGSNQFAETSTSGVPLVGAPGAGSLGLLQSGAVEDSNVDLTQELVNLITAQRVYQANAQTIKTQDQVLQTLVNLR